ncbi:hypothetical protein WMF37_42385 [Sorangium sp. So ce291]|uniref:hypothetical protein n=1 Tax=Sorangium sp. So ce291 TaxID=3133294 RepID=UPI003F621D64
MKISVVVSTLVGASLCAGVALAEGARTARAPRHIEIHRSRGDMVDRPYRHAPREQAAERSWRAERAEHAAPIPLSRGQERIRCSDTGTDCASRAAAAHRSRSEARAAAERAASAQRRASPLKSKAESRMNCSEAGECAASSAGARGAWAARSAGATREPAAAQGKERAAAPRDLAQRQSPRMGCSEGEECAMSSKEAAKFWAAQSIKAGTKSPSQIASERADRARRVAERQRERDARREKSDSASR